MIEYWLEVPMNNFHNLVFNTNYAYPIPTSRESVIKYLKIINHPEFPQGSSSNYDIIDYKKIFYLEEIYSDDKEIINLINEIKTKAKKAFIYKHQYLNRISDFIPDEKTDQYFDKYLMDILAFPKYPIEEE